MSWIRDGIDWLCGTIVVRGNSYSFKELSASGPNAVNNVNVTTFIVDDNVFEDPSHDNSVMVWALRGSASQRAPAQCTMMSASSGGQSATTAGRPSRRNVSSSHLS